MYYLYSGREALCLIRILIILTAVVSFMNGFTDAPNSLSNSVMTRAISPKAAVSVGAAMNFLGACASMLIGRSVVLSLSELFGTQNVSQSTGCVMLCCSLLTVILLAAVAWYFGIPTSESHALSAAAAGASLAATGGVSLSGCIPVVSGLFLSLAVGFIGGFISAKIAVALFKNTNNDLSQKVFRKTQIFFCILCSFMHGVQDGAKLSAVMGFCIVSPLLSTAFVAAAMSVGTLFGAGRIMKRVGEGFGKLKPYAGAGADIGTFVSLFICTALGMPVSTSHVKTAALCGAAAERSMKRVRWNNALSMTLAWLITFPFCFICSYVMTAVIVCG